MYGTRLRVYWRSRTKREAVMEVGRRDLLVGAASLGLVGMALPVGAGLVGHADSPPDLRWHQLTRSLLDRAKRAERRLDRPRVERVVREVAGEHGPLVIKWLESPERAFEHLLRYPLVELAQMPTARLWPFPPAVSATDYEAEERSIELHSRANQALRVEEHGLALLAPKLDFRARAVASLSVPEAIFEARAIAAEIGWIETSLPGAAAGSIRAVEDLLSAGYAEASVKIYHQLRVFEASEHGLLATWETPEEVICVPLTACA
jgi:hypothetical protein